MFVCPELQQRLDRAWSKLQEAFWQQGISQIDLDTLCVERIEKLAEEIVAIPTYSIVRQNNHDK